VIRTADALLDLLAEIALTPGTEEPNAEVRVLAWDHASDEEFTAAWTEFRDAVLARQAAPGTGDDFQAACGRVDAAYRVLGYGPAGGAR
jgi:hypothetical protein